MPLSYLCNVTMTEPDHPTNPVKGDQVVNQSPTMEGGEDHQPK